MLKNMFCLLLLSVIYTQCFSQLQKAELTVEERKMDIYQLTSYKNKQLYRLYKVLKGGIWDEIIPNLVYVPSFKFNDGYTGSDSLNPINPALHQITTRAFFVLNTEVTNKMYRYFLEDNNNDMFYPHFGNDTVTGTSQYFKNFKVTLHGKTYAATEYLQLDDYPVVGISYLAAMEFCEWLDRKKFLAYKQTRDSLILMLGGLHTLTAAEFESASIVNEMPEEYTNSRFLYAINNKIYATDKKRQINFGKVAETDSTKVRDYDADGYRFTNPVKAMKPGKIGIYGLMGNAAEWVADRQNNAIWPDTTKQHLHQVKGGSWYDVPFYLQPMVKQVYHAMESSERIGLRLSFGDNTGKLDIRNWHLTSKEIEELMYE